MSNTSIGDQCDALDGKVKYANEKLTSKDDATTGRIIIAGTFSAIARVLHHVYDQFQCFTPSIQAGEAVQRRRKAAADIAQELLAVGDAQATAAIASLPTFKLPAKRSSGGGAMSLGMASFGRDEDEHLPDARKKIVEEADVLKAFVEQTPPYGADTAAGKFIAALVAADLTKESRIDNVVEAAFEASEK